MPKRTSKSGSELFIVDNSDTDWKALRYLHDWCQLSKAIDVATGYFEIGGLLGLKDEWQKVDAIRILMGDEVSRRTKHAFNEALRQVASRLDDSLEAEKEKNDFLAGVPAIVDAIRSGKIQCRVYRRDRHGGWPGAFAPDAAPAPDSASAPLQPWQMTRGQYQAHCKAQGRTDLTANNRAYWREIEAALQAGHPVPENVRKEYKQLKAKK